MALKAPHRDWRLATISPIDVRAVDLDAVLTRFWLRIAHANRPLVSRAGSATTIPELALELEQRSGSNFQGFAEHRGTAEAWLRADLVKTLRRQPDRFTVARPLHALATRVRSGDRQTDDSNASLALYSWLDRVDRPLLAELRSFIDVQPGRDDDRVDSRTDLATYALALLGAQRDPDMPRSETPEELPPPLCLGQARYYADDMRRLLAYRDAMPRSALIDHLRRLTGLHLGLYLLRIFRIVVEAERGETAACSGCLAGRAPRETCPHDLELVVDCGEDARSPVAKLAEASWDRNEDLLAQYVRSHLALKKLDEFALDLEPREEDALPHTTLSEIAAVEGAARGDLIDLYFDARIKEVVAQSGGEDEANRTRELVADYRGTGLSPFRVYVALLAHFSERRWVSYHRYLLDSLFSKNSPEGMLRQPLGGPRRRRAAMGASLLETLTMVAVVAGEPGSFYTRPLQVDQLIAHLEQRYGMRIGTPPAAAAEDLEVHRLLAANVERFKARLRETGLFTDLSDAFLAQRVRPRHIITGAT